MTKKGTTAALAAFAVAALCTMTSCTDSGSGKGADFKLVKQAEGPVLGYSPDSGVNIINVEGLSFKDLNRNGALDAYEDWRLSPEERAAELASELSIDEIAGLMLYSSHQAIPAAGCEGGNPAAITEAQMKFLSEDNLRAVLITTVKSPEVSAKWNNNVQAFVEGLNHGIPVNTSSDPRNQSSSDMEFNAGGGGAISMWPSPIGMAATFDPATVRLFADIASQEYRALGIATALSPQVDLATEPRWWRFSGTFGECAALSADLARAYCDGFQTSDKEHSISGAWGYQSVNAMVKHWYGYGAQEAGRDGHFNHGKFAVYPGDNLAEQKIPFTEGAFKLEDGTGCASAVMPVYSILWNQDPSGENVGGAYSYMVIRDQLRGEAGFKGVVCTDWGITADSRNLDSFIEGKPWGVENLSVAGRHYRLLRTGVDQFGGNNDKGPVLEAYEMWVRDFGEESARERFEQSARRLLLNMFRVGLFENPYLNPEQSAEIVGNPEFMAAGFEAQKKSVVMLKNHSNVLPVARKSKVYLPIRHVPAFKPIWGPLKEGKDDWIIKPAAVSQYFEVVDNPEDADFALVAIAEPQLNLGYDYSEVAEGGNGYVPVSLQWDDYTAEFAREKSIAGGDPLESFTNRSYKGKTVRTANRDDMLLVQKTRKEMGEKPVIIVVETGKPVILSEIEPYADAVLLSFQVQNQAILDILCGDFEPSGLLPMQLPANMKTVELQYEDMAFDMDCYTDADGHNYDFAYGLNWSGVINDSRVSKYAAAKNLK